MPRLMWDGKEAVVNYDKRVPIHLLDEVPELAIPGDADKPTHTLIEGDNLLALKALMPRYKGRVKCIYIDPPYNTGNEGWVYNDNVNNPLVKRFTDWVGNEVGKDDLSRHDKWLCFMYPRLVLLRDLLADDGVMLISIDDASVDFLRCLLREVFPVQDPGNNQFVGCLVWERKRKGSFLSRKIAQKTEYILVYAKNPGGVVLEGEAVGEDEDFPLVKRTNSPGKLIVPHHCIEPTTLPDGIYVPGIYGKGGTSVEVLEATEIRDGKFTKDVHLRGPFVWQQSNLDREVSCGARFFIRTKNFQLRAVKGRENQGFKPMSSLLGKEVGTNEDASEELARIFQREIGTVFEYAKPTSLLRTLIGAVVRREKKAIVLDAFAGSGSTGQAVMELNQADGGSRECLLIQLGKDQIDGVNIAREVTNERLRRVSIGAGDETTRGITALKQGWRHYMVGQRLITPGELPADVPFQRLAPLVYWQATGNPMPPQKNERAFLGTSSTGTAVFLLYNGDMEDKDPKGDNALNRETWRRIKPHVEQAKRSVVYCTGVAGVASLIREFEVKVEQMPRCLERIGE